MDSILRAVDAIQSNATALGLVGAAFLLWSSLSLFSVLESAFNIVYGRPEPRLPAREGAGDADDGRVARRALRRARGRVGRRELLRRHASFVDNEVVATLVSVGVSLGGIFVFLATAYLVLTNASSAGARCSRRGRGGGDAGGDLPAPARVRPGVSSHEPGAQALSWQALLLVWLYVMANVTVLGAEVNWQLRRARSEPDAS